MTIGERIKSVRKAKDLTLAEFGAKIGITASSMSTIESGKSNPSEQTLLSICREFDVNDYWLRNGGDDADMFNRHERDEELSKFFGSIIKSGTDDFRRRFITALSKLGPEEWKALNEIANKMYQSGAYSENGEKKERS